MSLSHKEVTLDLKELREKRTTFADQLLITSFEYMLAEIAKLYSKSKGYKNLEEFNSKNKISFFKAVTFPFFVSISNGNSKSLFNLFSDFYRGSIGFISIKIYNTYLNHTPTETFFNLRNSYNPRGIEIKNTQANFDDLIENIKESILLHPTHGELHFANISIYNDKDNPKLLHEAIQNGIIALNENSENSFFQNDESEIFKQSRQFRAFRESYDKNNYEAVPYDEIKDDKSVSFTTNSRFSLEY